MARVPVIYISGPITKGRREDNLHQTEEKVNKEDAIFLAQIVGLLAVFVLGGPWLFLLVNDYLEWVFDTYKAWSSK